MKTLALTLAAVALAACSNTLPGNHARTLGSYSPGSDAGERHAPDHHFAWRGCVR